MPCLVVVSSIVNLLIDMYPYSCISDLIRKRAKIQAETVVKTLRQLTFISNACLGLLTTVKTRFHKFCDEKSPHLTAGTPINCF